jgi:catechol 2,3-dioxygenase-like lactoylglutathione lyase family enzyme
MTARTGGELPRIPGVRYADHVAFTVPDLDEAVRFFVQTLGAQELYRSTRGPDAQFMPENFAVPEDARLTLAMLRMPPNLNVELFEWSSSDRRTEHPRHSDAGGCTTSASRWTTWTGRSRCCATSRACDCSATAPHGVDFEPGGAALRSIAAA